MKELVIYVHGKGGTAEEAEHYKPLFPESDGGWRALVSYREADGVSG